MGILLAHARDEWNILSSTPFVIFKRAAAGFQTGDLRCSKDLVKTERWKIITSLQTFLTLWISTVFVVTLDEDMIKVRTVRDKSPKKWSLEFDLPKIKMFTAEDKRWRLVSRCWSFIFMNHGVIYCNDRQIRDPIWEGHFDFELIFLQLWS